MLRPVVRMFPKALEFMTPAWVTIPKHRIDSVTWDPMVSHVRVNQYVIPRPFPEEAQELYEEIRDWLSSETSREPSHRKLAD